MLARGAFKMRKIILLLTFCVLCVLMMSSCVSEKELYGNWYSPQACEDTRQICTVRYILTLSPPDKYKQDYLISKSSYEVGNYGLFLRLKHPSEHIDNVFNLFGFVIADRTSYWLGFIPVLGFQYSYKISDEEMLDYLRKYKFSEKQVLDVPIRRPPASVLNYEPDHSAPDIMKGLPE